MAICQYLAQLILPATILAVIGAACTSEPVAPQPTVTPAPPISTPLPAPIQTPISASNESSSVRTQSPLQEAKVEKAFPKISFDRMVSLAYPEGVTDRLFLVLQPGRIMVFDNSVDPTSSDEFLDIRSEVSDRGSEEGLLSLAFDPNYRDNGYFYVYYSASNPRRSVISRFAVSSDPNRADPATQKIVMEIPQPFANHNGGQIAFGPDRYLYVGLGDGGGGGDRQRHGQNLGTLLGTILRIDVSSIDTTGTHAVPPDNPFVGVFGARPEIWAYGLRNPWRFSFDSETGDLWAGDVGQSDFEEIDLVTPGGNYGWNTMEASSCFRSANCERDGLKLPVVEYGRDDGCSVTGGYVYRGTRLPSLLGAYVYGDFCSGRIWAMRYDGTRVVEHMRIANTDLRISSFAEGPDGELYILSFTGNIFRFEAGK